MLELPKSVFFIASGEFAERFAFYGLGAVLPLFFLARGLSEDASVSALAFFKAVCYVSPLAGAVIADGVLGKYRTIVGGMTVYTTGMTVVALSTLQLAWWPFIVGLLLVGIATGAIKSVVAALLGDQVAPHQVRAAFSVFYASIQCGSILTFIVTPLLRTQVPPPYNWTVAMGVPAATMLIAFGCFTLAKRWYVIRPSTGSQLLRFLLLLWVVVRRFVASLFVRGGYMQLRLGGIDGLLGEEFSVKEKSDARAVLSVLATFLLFPLYFAAVEQQGSRWIFQMMRMDRTIPFLPKDLSFPVDASGIYNPILTLAFVPVVNKLPLSSLRKMLLGFVFAAVAFGIAATLELLVIAFPERISFLFQLPQYVCVSASEVLTYAVGLEFAYSEAPESMKSICQAALLLTISAGNLLLALLALLSSSIANQPLEYSLYAALMIGAAALFFLQIRFYRYKAQREDGSATESETSADIELAD